MVFANKLSKKILDKFKLLYLIVFFLNFLTSFLALKVQAIFLLFLLFRF